jgi:hypothetical protein
MLCVEVPALSSWMKRRVCLISTTFGEDTDDDTDFHKQFQGRVAPTTTTTMPTTTTTDDDGPKPFFCFCFFQQRLAPWMT